MLEYLSELIKKIPHIENKEEYRSVFTEISSSYFYEKFHSNILAYYL